ncbi:outer membrane beta-barrel protein [Parasediminibacterium paludis]|uniref:Outer membrane beta-barrel protein n=1 Tax=Parasediminibacterium paludis TaxID=908966 RepID=A0ABV8Q133_9BACT
MRKIQNLCLLVFLLVIGSANYVNAQAPKALVFGNFTVVSPQGTDFTKDFANGFGFEIGGGLGIGKTMIIGSAGYINYLAATTTTTYGDLNVIPIKVGFRRYLVGKLFVNGQIGTAIESYSKGNTSGSKFLYEVGAGVKIIHLIEVGAAYTSYQSATTPTINYNTLLFKVGFSVKF